FEAFSGCLEFGSDRKNIGAAVSRCPGLTPFFWLRTRRSQVRVLQGAPLFLDILRSFALVGLGVEARCPFLALCALPTSSSNACDPQKSHPGEIGCSVAAAPTSMSEVQASNRTLHRGIGYHPAP